MRLERHLESRKDNGGKKKGKTENKEYARAK
jgi:hypothetical protein